MGSSSSKSSNTNTRSKPKNVANATSSESRPMERPNPTEKTSKPTVHPVHIPSPEQLSSNPPAYSSSRQSEYIQPSSYINKFTNQTLVGPMLPLRLLLSSYNTVSQYSYEKLESQFILSKYHSRKLQGIDLAHYLQHIHSFCPDTSPLHVSLATVSTRFPLIRGVARDGDCFYRSVLVILVEQLRYLSLFNPHRAISLLKHIAKLKRYVVEVSGELCDELWDVFIETLTTAAGVSYVDFVDLLALEQRRVDIIAADQAAVASGVVADNPVTNAENDAIDASIAPSAPVDNVDDNVDNVERPVTMITVGAPQSTPWMHAFQNEPHRALSSISMLRLLTSARLRHDPELQLYVDEEIEFHCKTQVEPLHHDADHVHLTALLRILCLCVRVCVVNTHELQVMRMPQGQVESRDADATDEFWMEARKENSGNGIPEEQKSGVDVPFSSLSSSGAAANSSEVSENTPVRCGAALLFLPGHYEIIYPETFASILDAVEGQ